MEFVDLLRWAHIIGATVLLGTGAGIAFFMVMAHRTGNAAFIAHTASIVVIADFVFTASAVIAQPVSGYFLAQEIGWDITEGWIVLSLTLYVGVGLFWLPVVWMQHQIRGLAREAAENNVPLPERYFSLFRRWFVCGFPAFIGVMIILWLMIARPEISF